MCAFAAYLGLSESAVSHQIRRLKDLALVRSRRDGQILYYSLDDYHVDELIQVGLDHLREK
ncbi:MAG: ArsR family transcriptional regulator [Desulfatiglandales bacterium]|nr:ArsR family transcriptional regulator [Desulfatiglandales bacterium]